MNANSKPLAPTVKQWLTDTISQLMKAGIPSARLDAELILTHVLDKDRVWLITHSDAPITESLLGEDFAFPAKRGDTNAPLEPSESETSKLSVIEQANNLVEQRINRIPLAYLIGYKEFYGRNFLVTPDVLIPRPESEMIVHVLKELRLPENATIYDVGTGSGSLAITIALEFALSTVIGSDISETAIKLAQQNAKALGASKNVSFRHANLLEGYEGTCEAIVANLPYVDRTWERSPETDQEPALALFADDEGLAIIKECVTQAKDRLRKKGYLLLEADPVQHPEIIEWAGAHGFRPFRTDDYIVTLQRL